MAAGTKIRGKNWEVWFGATGSQKKAGAVKDASLSITSSEIDASDHDSGAWGETMTGVFKWNATLNGFYLELDTDQQALEAAAIAGTTLDIEIRPNGTGATKSKRTGKCQISSIEFSAPTDGLVSCNMQVRGIGELAVGVQSA